MKRHYRIPLLLCSLCTASLTAVAQNTTNLPTSMYGVGELSAGDGGRYAGMGNTGIALNRTGFLNTLNPAAITRMDTACFTFDVGASASYARYSFLSEHSSNFTGNPNRISMSFRVLPRWYALVGAAPYSSVGYVIQTEEEIEGMPGNYTYSLFEGTGGLYRCYVLPLNGMLTSLSTNFGRRNKDVRLYEMGNIYLPKQLPLTELPEERMQLTFGMYGDGDFFTMKGVIEELLYQTGLRKKAQYDPHAELPFLHPGRKAAIVYDGAVIGYLGEVHPTVAANYAIKERVYIAVIDMPEIVSRASFDYKYEGITNFPVSSRDLSMVVPKNILVGDIEKVFEENGGKYLENYELFDVYEGEQIEKGFKSVAYSLKFRGKDKNLEESDITGAMDKILSGLKNIGIQLRG